MPVIIIAQTLPSEGLRLAIVASMITAAFTANSRISAAAAAEDLRNALKYPLKQAANAPGISARGISLTARLISELWKKRSPTTPENKTSTADTAVLRIRHSPSPQRSTRSGFFFVLPSSSEIRRLVQRNALPLETVPAKTRKEPVSESMPIADVPSFLLIKAFSSSADVSRKSCITVSIIVSFMILFLNISSSCIRILYILLNNSANNSQFSRKSM